MQIIQCHHSINRRTRELMEVMMGVLWVMVVGNKVVELLVELLVESSSAPTRRTPAPSIRLTDCVGGNLLTWNPPTNPIETTVSMWRYKNRHISTCGYRKPSLVSTCRYGTDKRTNGWKVKKNQSHHH